MAQRPFPSDVVTVDQGGEIVRLLGIAVLLLGGALLIFVVDGSLRGIGANTIGAVLVLLALVSALVIAMLRATRAETGPRGEGDQPATLRRR
jgi:hypothetical protein